MSYLLLAVPIFGFGAISVVLYLYLLGTVSDAHIKGPYNFQLKTPGRLTHVIMVLTHIVIMTCTNDILLSLVKHMIFQR